MSAIEATFIAWQIGHAVIDFVLWTGPGLVFAFGAWLCVWAWDRVDLHLAARAARRENDALIELDALEQHLTDTWAQLTDARKEKP